MSGWRRNDFLKVIILVPITIVATLLAISSANIVSLTEVTRLGVHSLFVYWTCISLAVILLSLQSNFNFSKLAFSAAFLFFVVVRLFSAVVSLLSLENQAVITPINITSRVFEISLFALLLFIGVLTHQTAEKQQARWQDWKNLIPLLGIPLLLTLLSFLVFLPLLSTSELGIVCMIYFAICLIFLIPTPFIWQRKQFKEITINSGYLLTACILLIIASALMTLSTLNQSDVWILGENIQIAAFFVLGLAFCVSFLRRQGFQRITSYAIYIILGVVSYAPLLITTLLESLNLTQYVGPENYLAYAIIHIGVSSLSIMMAILVHAYSRLRLSAVRHLLIPLFIVWSSVAITSLTNSIFPLVPRTGEPIIPYLMGGILTIFLLWNMRKQLTRNITDSYRIWSSHQILVISVVYSIIVWLSDLGDQVLYGLIVGIDIIGLGKLLLLLTNYLLMLSLAYIIFLLARVTKKTISFEMYVVSFLAFWILPSTLKNFYQIWSTGWWLSEGLFFVGVLVGPVILSFLYIQAMREMNESHSRAKLYADLLMHDITNYNQMALTTLELLASNQVTGEELERIINDAQRAVAHANQLVSNVRLLNETDEWMNKPMYSIDLVKSIIYSLDSVTKSQRYPDRVIRLSSDTVHAYVMANESLDYAIINFLYTALEIPSKDNEILLTVNATSNIDEKWWSVQLDIPDVTVAKGKPELYEEDIELRVEQSLGFQVAKMIIEQMEGYIEIQKLISDDSLSILMSLNLPFSPEQLDFS